MNESNPTTWQVLKSVMASFFGVQNEKTRRRDFTYGKPSQFITIGLILTAFFIIVIYLIVKIILYITLGS